MLDYWPTFCKEEEESVNHLIFNCKISSSLWHYCIRQWNVSMCFPKCRGHASFLCHCMSIWNIRNKIAFQNFQPNWEFEKRRLFWLLGMRIRGWCPHFPFSPGQIQEDWIVIKEWEN